MWLLLNVEMLDNDTHVRVAFYNGFKNAVFHVVGKKF